MSRSGVRRNSGKKQNKVLPVYKFMFVESVFVVEIFFTFVAFHGFFGMDALHMTSQCTCEGERITKST